MELPHDNQEDQTRQTSDNHDIPNKDQTEFVYENFEQLLSKFTYHLLTELDRISEFATTSEVEGLIDTLVIEYNLKINASDLKRLKSELIGIGPLDTLLHDPRVTAIRVNNPAEVDIESDGQWSRSNITFFDKAHLLRMVDRLLARCDIEPYHTEPFVQVIHDNESQIAFCQPEVAQNTQNPILLIHKAKSEDW